MTQPACLRTPQPALVCQLYPRLDGVVVTTPHLFGSKVTRVYKCIMATLVNGRDNQNETEDASAYFEGGSEFQAYPLPSSRLGNDDACCDDACKLFLRMLPP
jgi:hypothetical protein